MRPALLVWALAAIAKITIASPEPADDATLNDEEAPTVFNGITVPPLPEVRGPDFKETVANGVWFVKFYSPTCPHCQAVKQTWQTLYEFYTTSAPLQGLTKDAQPDLNSPNSFHGFYNFHFASVNCQAFGDACDKEGVRGYPEFKLYRNGEFITKYHGERTMENFSTFVEEALEKIKAGSRPKGGVQVLEPGDKQVSRDPKPPKAPSKGKQAAPPPEAAAATPPPRALNEKEAILSPETKSRPLLPHETARLNKKPPSKSGPLPNPLGASVPLSAESFQTLVTQTQDPWFVKFYAPWCQHCQHLAPTWTQMAREMQGKLNIGEVNCDLEPRLCKEAKVNAYPTIYFFRGGERVEFEGLRGLGDLLTYATKAIDSDVKYVDEAAFVELERTEDVIFTYFFDHATTSEDFSALDRLTLSLIGHAKLVKTDSDELSKRFKIHTWPKLLVVRSGRPTFYTALAPQDMRDFRRVFAWMQSVWLPIVPELTAANAREIMSGKFAVLGVLSRDKPDQFVESKNELKSAALEWMEKRTTQFQLERQELRDAKQLRIEEAEDRDDQRALRQAKSRVISISEDNFRKQVRFAWVDGVFWERWLRSTYGVDIAHGERVIIADEDNRRYWDLTDTGNLIVPSRTSILETLTRVSNNPPKLASKSTVGFFEGIFFRIRNMGTHHPWFSCSVLAAAVVLLIYILRTGTSLKLGRSGNGYFRLDEKNGILGGNNGKKE